MSGPSPSPLLRLAPPCRRRTRFGFDSRDADNPAAIFLAISESPGRWILETLADNDELPSLVATLAEAESALASADSLIAPDSDASVELKRLLFELADAAKAIRRLAEQLEEHPESLLRGKKEAGQ